MALIRRSYPLFGSCFCSFLGPIRYDSLPLFKCWTRAAFAPDNSGDVKGSYTDAGCFDEELLWCGKGAAGVMCGSCDRSAGYTFSASKKRCFRCSSQEGVEVALAAVIVVLLLLGAVGMACVRKSRAFDLETKRVLDNAAAAKRVQRPRAPSVLAAALAVFQPATPSSDATTTVPEARLQAKKAAWWRRWNPFRHIDSGMFKVWFGTETSLFASFSCARVVQEAEKSTPFTSLRQSSPVC
jgi:hypothetical protein